jgi:Zn-dependent protease with chaperone function
VNFFEHQERARKSSGRLVFLFIAAIVGIVLCLYLLASVALLYANRGQPAANGLAPFSMDLFLPLAASIGGIVLIGTLFKFFVLRAGGRQVAESLGGRLINPQTTSPAERRLVNVVEEMAIASGIPVPSIYVLDREQGLNAFAAGHAPDDAAVAVTAGLLKTLNRDELQGVVAHEFSHILNGDMKLNIRLLGLLGGVMAIAVVGRILLQSGATSRRKKDGGGILLIGLGMMILGYIGVLAGRIIQAAISRQREYLADASAVQFTRNPGGIGGALRHIREAVEGSRVAAPQAAEVSHMFFGPLSLSRLFATHPPLEERIRRIEGPGADLSDAHAAADRAAAAAPAGAAGFAAHGAATAAPAGAAGFAGEAAAVAASVGTLTQAAIDSSVRLLGKLPPRVRDAAGSPLGAASVACALLVDAEPRVRKAQLAMLVELGGPMLARETGLLLPDTEKLDPRLKLPLLDLAIPALRQLSRGQFSQVKSVLAALAQADNQVTLFEFCLQRIVDRRVGVASTPRRKERSLSAVDVRKHAAVVLGAVAYGGSRTQEEATAAFVAGAEVFKGLLSMVDMPSQDSASLAALGASLDALALGDVRPRQMLLEACATAVMLDRKVTLEESEILRAVAYSLSLPLPPFVD